MTACMGLPLLRALCLAGARVMKHVAAPRLGALLQRDAGLVMKTAFLSPHAPRPCLPVWPCPGHAWPRVLPFTTLHDDGLLGRADRRFVKKEKKKTTDPSAFTGRSHSWFIDKKGTVVPPDEHAPGFLRRHAAALNQRR
jgi:hypothetical protein